MDTQKITVETPDAAAKAASGGKRLMTERQVAQYTGIAVLDPAPMAV